MTKAIDPTDLVEAQVVRFPSFDGTAIPNIFYKPWQASPQAKAPAVIWVHGGPGGQTRQQYNPYIQYLVNHGYSPAPTPSSGSVSPSPSSTPACSRDAPPRHRQRRALERQPRNPPPSLPQQRLHAPLGPNRLAPPPSRNGSGIGDAPHGPVYELRSPRAVQMFLPTVGATARLARQRRARRPRPRGRGGVRARARARRYGAIGGVAERLVALARDTAASPRAPPPPNRPPRSIDSQTPIGTFHRWRRPTRFALGLVQMRCSTDPDDNLARAVARHREAAGQRRADRLPARAVPHPVLLPARGPRALRPGRADSRARRPRRSAARRARSSAWSSSRRCSSGAPRASTTTRRSSSTPTARCRPLPEDAHPGRPALLREVLLHAGRPRVLARSTRRAASVGTLVCWDQWYPEARG